MLNYSEHAIKRMKQRAITAFEVEYLLRFPAEVRIFKDRKIASAFVGGRHLKVVFVEGENYIKIITVM